MSKTKIEDLLQMKDVISLVNILCTQALVAQASDIHINPEEHQINVRFRIDGLLQDAYTFPREIHQEIIARIKILTELRTDEHYVSQDGRFKIPYKDEFVDIRVSIVPTYYGENAVLRLLRPLKTTLELTQLGFSVADSLLIEKVLNQSHGMILVTGPTGSGKTTTLYTLLKKIQTSQISITTIEDPIEYAVQGVRQIQVHAHKGLNFSNGLRAIMRQDPDIIMVGEIRDYDTASIAVHAALSGHMLFSTLHTNDAVTTILRLIDMHIEPYIVASTIKLVISQRLVRKRCELCNGKACKNCNQSGFSGRTIIYELLHLSNSLKKLLLKKVPAHILQEQAVKEGFVSIYENGYSKVTEGITSLEEVLGAI